MLGNRKDDKMKLAKITGMGAIAMMSMIGMPAFERVLERNSAPSQDEKPQIPTTIRPDRDARAADLLKNREALAAQAREFLDGFERDEEDGR
jgi:hypothetical protein